MTGDTVLFRGRTLVQGRDFDRKHGDILLMDRAKGLMACLRCGERWVARLRHGGFYAAGSARCARCGGATRHPGRPASPASEGRRESEPGGSSELQAVRERLDDAVLNLRELVRTMREIPRLAAVPANWAEAAAACRPRAGRTWGR